MDFSPHLFVSHVIDSPRFVSICMKSWLAQGSWRVSLKRGVRAGAGNRRLSVFCFVLFFVENIFSTREEKFRISKRPYNVLFII